MNRNHASVALSTAVFSLIFTNVLLLTNDSLHEGARKIFRNLFGDTATTSELRILRAENVQLRNDNRRLVSTDLALQASSVTLAAATYHLVDATNRLVATHDNLKTHSLAQKEVAIAVRKKVSMRLMPAVTRAVSSLPGKSAPVFGTGVVIAMTALDVRDLCETLKDMQTLGDAFEDDPADESKICGLKAPTLSGIRAKAETLRKRMRGD